MGRWRWKWKESEFLFGVVLFQVSEGLTMASMGEAASGAGVADAAVEPAAEVVPSAAGAVAPIRPTADVAFQGAA